MAKYWFSVFTPSTWEQFQSMEQRYLGFSEHSGKKAKNIKDGDVVITYVTGAKKLTGVFDVAGPLERIGSKVWGTIQFPFCIKVTTSLILDLDKAPLFLDFAETQSWYRSLSKKQYWSFAFRNSPKSLSPRDALPIIKGLREIASKE